MAKYHGADNMDMPAILSILTAVTGDNSLNFSGYTDPFMTGGENSFDSAKLFFEKYHDLSEQGFDRNTILGKLYGTLGLSKAWWDSNLANEEEFLGNYYDFNKQYHHYQDPNEARTLVQSPGGLSSSDPYMQLAIKAAKPWNINPNLLYAQWYHETAGFTSELSKYNNFAGIKGAVNDETGHDSRGVS